MAWVKIKDYHSIESLADALSTTGSATATVVEAFTDYLRQCLAEVAQIQAGLADAKNLVGRELAEAQSDLDSCRWSQEWDEDLEEYYPDCEAEEERRDELQVQFNEICKAYDSVTENLKECEWQLKQWQGDTMPSDPMSVVAQAIAFPATVMIEALQPANGCELAKWCVDLCVQGESRLSRIARHCERYFTIAFHRLNQSANWSDDQSRLSHVQRDLRIEGTGLHTVRCKHGYIQKKCPLCNMN